MLTMLRVGETQNEYNHRMSGHYDDPLTDQGYLSMREVGSVLQTYQWDAIYCSRGFAAVQTGKLFRPDIIVVPALDERCAGVFENVRWDEIRETLPPKRYKLWERDWFRCPPSGESYQDVEERIRAWAKSTLWPAMDRDKKVLVIRYETPLKVLMGLLRGLEPDEVISSTVEPAVPYFWHGKSPDPKG